MTTLTFRPLTVDEVIRRANDLAHYELMSSDTDDDREFWGCMAAITGHEYPVSDLTIWKLSANAALGNVVLRTGRTMQEIRRQTAELLRRARLDIKGDLLVLAIREVQRNAKEYKRMADYDDTSRSWSYWQLILFAIERMTQPELKSIQRSDDEAYNKKLQYLLQCALDKQNGQRVA